MSNSPPLFLKANIQAVTALGNLNVKIKSTVLYRPPLKNKWKTLRQKKTVPKPSSNIGNIVCSVSRYRFSQRVDGLKQVVRCNDFFKEMFIGKKTSFLHLAFRCIDFWGSAYCERKHIIKTPSNVFFAYCGSFIFL